MTSAPENSALLDRARAWAEQAQSVLGSRQELDQKYLLMVLALGAITGLLLGLHSLLLIGQGASQVRSPWPLLIGGVACAALWTISRRRRHAPLRLLLLVSAALCAGNVMAIALNGVMGLTFVTGVVVVVHLLLAPRVALVLVGVYLLCTLSAVWWYHGAMDSGLYVRALATGLAALVGMQLLARHWDDIGKRLQRLTQEMSSVIERTDLEIDTLRLETTQLERTDPLTGLPNRLGFVDQATGRLQQQAQSVLACIRLMRWRSAMATLAYSDQQTLTTRLVNTVTELLGEDALVGRLGPDEFVVLVEGEGPRGDNTVQRLGVLQEALARPVVAGPVTALTEPLVGFSRAPSDSQELGELMRQAEVACASSEGNGSATPQAFDVLLARTLRERAESLQALANALELGQLDLDLEPLVRAGSGQACGAEARAMWTDPQHGRISTAQLLPYGMASGLTDRITLWKLQAAAQLSLHLRKQGSQHLPLSINLPAPWLQRTVREPGAFLERLTALRLPPGAFVFEIPEEALLTDVADLSQLMTLWKSMGIRLAIDHFGAGLSCLHQLDRLPVDLLKMDRTFVARVGLASRETAVCRSIVRVAHQLRLQVIAEGVISAEQAHRLSDIGCDVLQGPGVAPTLRAEGLQPWLQTRQRPA